MGEKTGISWTDSTYNPWMARQVVHKKYVAKAIRKAGMAVRYSRSGLSLVVYRPDMPVYRFRTVGILPLVGHCVERWRVEQLLPRGTRIGR